MLMHFKYNNIALKGKTNFLITRFPNFIPLLIQRTQKESFIIAANGLHLVNLFCFYNPLEGNFF